MSQTSKQYETAPPTVIKAIRRITTDTPPGGGACWWCSRQLYIRRGLWRFAEIKDEYGHAHAVHIHGCENGMLDPRQNGEGVRLELTGP